MFDKRDTLNIEGEELEEALQYGPSGGSPKFREWLVEFQKEVHNREVDGEWDVTVGAGCQNLLTAVSYHFLPMTCCGIFAGTSLTTGQGLWISFEPWRSSLTRDPDLCRCSPAVEEPGSGASRYVVPHYYGRK